MKQFSLFTEHTAPVIQAKQPAASSIQRTTQPVDDPPQLVSKDELRRQRIEGFNVKECVFCGSEKIGRIGMVFYCKRCGTEYSLGGVKIGDKVKMGEQKYDS